MCDNKQSVIFKEYAKTKDPNAKVVTMSLKMEEEAILNAATGKNKEEKEKLYNFLYTPYMDMQASIIGESIPVLTKSRKNELVDNRIVHRVYTKVYNRYKKELAAVVNMNRK